jgi:PBP1b-binding outer membrane lipoprotein LpoB
MRRGVCTLTLRRAPARGVAWRLVNQRKPVMTMFKRFSALFLAALLVSACAGTPKQESTGEYIDDSWITTKVKSAILAEPSLKVTQITVETYKGVVQLSGFVDSAAAATRAVELAREVKGVSSVKNDTRLR